jgi:phytoene synthase
MIRSEITAAEGSAAEQGLALRYVPADRREGMAALLALDRTLGGILRSTREPIVGQMRLVWWRDALEALDRSPPPAEPVLAALAAKVLPHGVSGAQLAAVVEGWEALLAPVLDDVAVDEHARARGGGLFTAAARMLGDVSSAAAAAAAAAGQGWALADLSRNLSTQEVAMHARNQAAARFKEAFATRWPSRLRGLGALAMLARMDLEPHPRPPGHPARVWRLLRFRVTGR